MIVHIYGPLIANILVEDADWTYCSLRHCPIFREQLTIDLSKSSPIDPIILFAALSGIPLEGAERAASTQWSKLPRQAAANSGRTLAACHDFTKLCQNNGA